MYGIYEDGQVIAKFTAPLQLISNVPVLVGDALSLQRSVAKRTAQRWEIITGVEPLSHSSNKLFSLFARAGAYSKIQVTVPQNFGAMKQLTATAAVNAVGAKLSSTVTITSFSGKIPAGYLVKFQGHDKIYMVVKDTVGGGQMEIFPPLREAVSGQLIYKNVTMECWIDTDTVKGMSFIDGILMQAESIKLIEALK